MNINRKAIALVTGVNDYADSPLQCCINDAQEISVMLTEPEYGFSVSVLLDQDVTRTNLLNGLRKLFDSDADVILFYFSGHGWASPYGAYLVTVDANPVEPGIDLPIISRFVNAYSKQGRFVIVILDCCHAGSMEFKDFDCSRMALKPIEIVKAFPSLPEGNLLLAACKPDELAAEDTKIGHSIFTHYLLEGLLGDAANDAGEVTPGSLHDYVSRALATCAIGQSVQFRGDIAGAFVIGKGFKPIQRLEFNNAVAIEIERDAEKHINDYQKSTGQEFSDREFWAQSGYKSACQLLTPVLQWFSRKEEQCPELKLHKNFRRYYDEVLGWQTRLSHLDGVRETPWGEIDSRLGYGTFGTVWKVKKSDEPKQLQAWKVYHGQDIRLRDKVHRFRRGYEAMRMLDHPHIVKVGELTECPLGFFMDYIDGPNLRDFTGALELIDQVRVLLTIGETLCHAHSRSVVHRDVKPENIIMKFDDSTWHPYLTDFDLAWFSTASVLTKEAIGTTFYSAPEQIYKPSSLIARNPQVDVYSFGQLCFYAITSSDPLPNPPDNYYALKERLSQWPAGDAATEMLSLYQEATKHNPAERIKDCRTICDKLHRIIILLKSDPSSFIAVDRFVREIIFGLIGISEDSNSDLACFKSLSTRAHVDIEIKDSTNASVSLSFHMQRQGSLTMEGVDHETARRRLNMRVDEVLRNSRNVKRRSGHSGSYSVYVDFYMIPLTFNGVDSVRRLLSRVIEAIERD
jgi:serine/threonine protein kinase